MRATAWHDEPTIPPSWIWVSKDRSESLEVPDFTISERTAPTEEVPRKAVKSLLDLDEGCVTEKTPRARVLAAAARLPRAAVPAADTLPAIESGALPRPSRFVRLGATQEDPSVHEDASTGLFESLGWDEADPHATGPFAVIAEALQPEPSDRRPHLSVVRSAPLDPMDADWSNHRATPLPLPPRPLRSRGARPPAPRPVAQRPAHADDNLDEPPARTHDASRDEWERWGTQTDDDELALDPETGDHHFKARAPVWRYWLAVAFHATAFAMGFAATFLSGGVALLVSAVAMLAVRLG